MFNGAQIIDAWLRGTRRCAAKTSRRIGGSTPRPSRVDRHVWPAIAWPSIAASTIAASTAVFASACTSPNSPSAPTTSTVLTTYTVSGTVSEATATGAQPVEGVQIEETATHRRTTTDANGVYHLSGLLALSNSISASKSGYATTSSMVIISGDTHLDLRIVRIERVFTYTLAGAVFERTAARQLPVSEASIALGEGYPDLTATTDSDGRFSIAGVRATTWGFTASKNGYETFLMSIAVAADTALEITLTRSAR
jgi:hypothetical protein